MNRETKVGLLVGLGIILLVGIIVSDHLSVAQRQQAADLTQLPDRARLSVSTPLTSPVVPPRPQADSSQDRGEQDTERGDRPRRHQAYAYDPVFRADEGESQADQRGGRGRVRATNIWRAPGESESDGYGDPSNIDGGRGATPAPRPVNLVTAEREAERKSEGLTTPRYALASRDDPAEEAGRRKRPVRREEGTPLSTTVGRPARDLSPMIHEVRSGESLWVIAERYYDNGGYWKRIAEANRDVVGADGTVREGIKLVIPDHAGRANRAVQKEDRRTTAGRENRKSSADSRERVQASRRQKSASKTVVVEEGDTLSSIAQKHLGSGRRWPALYKVNRDKLANPDAVYVGQVLRLPAE